MKFYCLKEKKLSILVTNIITHFFTIGPTTFITTNALVKNPRLLPMTPETGRVSELGMISGCVLKNGRKYFREDFGARFPIPR